MKQKTKSSIKKAITNLFGSFGYLFCFLQWLWAVLLYFSVVQSASKFVVPTAPKHIEQPAAASFALPGWLTIVIVAIIVIVMVAVTVYAFVKLPMNIVKKSNEAVHKTAETMTPLVLKAQHKKDTQKAHFKMTARLIFVIKSLLIFIPLAASAASGLLQKQAVDYSIALAVGCGLAGISALLFAAQYILGRLLHVKLQDIR